MDNKTRGGQFLVKETKCEDIFTPEDFNEEQIMMRDSVREFVDKEIWPHKNRFENKDFALTEETMKKAGDLGFLSVAVPEAYGGMGMGFVNTVLVRFLLLLVRIQELEPCQLRFMELRSKSKDTFQNSLLANGLALIV
jgi:alkylation response protein AidB-like acyl-CoA dehydrogenase